MSESNPPFSRRRPRLALAFAFALSGLLLPALAQAADAPDCGVGAWQLADGTSIDIGRSEGDTLRWRRPDGRTGAFHTTGADAGTSTLGWTKRPDGTHLKIDCAAGTVAVDGVVGHRMPLSVTETRFDSDNTTLVGRLVMPPGDGPVPIVVLLHGSEHDAALDFESLQRRLPAQGVGAFVYDKRGTGISGGGYTQDFDQLARDAVAAVREARRLAGARAGRVGLQGPSEGGWVAPIAARATPVDFVTVAFGLAVSVLDEDREAVVMNIEAGHHDAQVMADALEIADACASLALSPTAEGFDRFDRVRQRYEHETWYPEVRGDFCWFALGVKKAEFASLAKLMDFHTPWLYDPMTTIAAVQPPQLWILAQDDLDAPSAETARRLALLRAAGRPISTAMLPHTEHGLYEYELAPDGSRLSTRQPEGTLRLMVDFARGPVLRPPYGPAVLAQPGH